MSASRWIGLSLAMHAAALWAMSEAPAPNKAALARVQMQIVSPPRPAAPPPPIPQTKRQPTAANVPRATTQAQPADAEAQPAVSLSPRMATAPPLATDPAASGGVVLPNSLALRGLAGPPPPPRAATGFLSAFQDDGLDEKTRVEKRVKETTDAIATQLDTRTGARGTARTMRKALEERFAPIGKLVEDLPSSSEAWGNRAEALRDGYKRAQGTATADNAKAGPNGTFDPCSASHEIGRREMLVRAEHDERGQVTRVTTVKSSGKEPYDRYAEGVVKDALSRELPMEKDEAIPLFSEWALAQVVYDWMTTPQCFDQIRPVGRPVYPNATLPMAITYTSEVTLKAVRYRRASKQ